MRKSPAFGEKPGRSPANRSLERGLSVLRAFRPGSDVLGNGDIAERTGLSRATVSRLTHTLVGAGMLQHDERRRVFRLAPAVLSFAHAMKTGSHILQVAAPLMRDLAERHGINVGLAAPDGDEMVYLESIRYARRASFRNVVSGQRVPMELTSLGRAYLAVAPDARRKALLAHFRRRRGAKWAPIAAEIERAMESVQRRGYCSASWQPEVVAIATPLVIGDATYVLNVSISTREGIAAVERELGPLLMKLRAEVQSRFVRRQATTTTPRARC